MNRRRLWNWPVSRSLTITGCKLKTHTDCIKPTLQRKVASCPPLATSSPFYDPIMFIEKTIPTQHVLYADDDEDDCFLFEEALKQSSSPYTLTTVHNGEELMNLLNRDDCRLPDVLFLDLNMPRKNGFQCLQEIGENEKLKMLPVVILSTSYASSVAAELHLHGAKYYIRKPHEFTHIRTKICRGLSLLHTYPGHKPSFDEFVL
jgi:CheY-like chemotaxis protein